MRVLPVLARLFVSATASAAQIPGTFTYAAGELPEMRLAFEPDGKLLFHVGFEFWNPARWRIDSAAGELRITIPKLRPEDASTFEEDASRGSIKGFDSRTKTIIYRYSDSTSLLFFAGFLYVRDPLKAPERDSPPSDQAGPPNKRLKLAARVD